MALGISGYILIGGANLWLISWQLFGRSTHLMQALDDEWILYTALKRDVLSSQSVRVSGSVLTVAMTDGQVAKYWLSSASNLLLRTLNGYGEVVVSTKVKSWQPQIDVLKNVVVEVNYDQNGEVYDKAFTLSTKSSIS